MLLSRSPSGPKKYFPIPVAHLEEEIRVRSADDCKRFREEFNVSAGLPSALSYRRELGNPVTHFRVNVPKAQNSCISYATIPQTGAPSLTLLPRSNMSQVSETLVRSLPSSLRVPCPKINDRNAVSQPGLRAPG